MKRFTSILCALCLVIGTLSGICLTPAEQTKAQVPPEVADYPGTVTAIHFSDKKFSDYASLAEVKVSTGAAVSLGGKSKWTHGIIVIEPATGWKLNYVEFCGETIQYDTVTNVIDTVKQYVGGEQNIPDSVKTALNSVPATAAAVYIDSSRYTSYSTNRSIDVEFRQIEDANQEEGIVVSILDDSEERNFEKDTEESFNIFDIWDGEGITLPAQGYQRSDYEIEIGGYNSADIVISKLYENEISNNYGQLKCDKNGKNVVTLKNKKNGLEYKAYITVNQKMPIAMNSFTVSSGAKIEDDSGTGKDIGKYVLSPVGKNYFTQMSVSFTLPDGMTVKDIQYDGESFGDDQGILSESGTVAMNWFKGEYSIDNSSVSIGVSTVNDYSILDGKLTVVLAKGNEELNYSFRMAYIPTVSVNPKSGNTYQPMTIGRTLKMSDFLNFGSAEDERKLYDGIVSGIYEFEMQGIRPLIENGKFNGDLVVYYPCDHMNIYDHTNGTRLCGCNISIPVRASALIEAGTTLDLTTILGTYWDSTDHSGNRWYTNNRTIDAFTVETAQGNTYSMSSDNKKFTAPASVQGLTTYVLKNYLTDITVTVCPAGTLMNSLTDVAATVKEDENLLVDVKSNASLSKDTLNSFKTSGGNNSSITIINRNNVHTPEWHFNKNDLTTADKDISLDIAVGSEVTNSALSRVKGLKVGFATNGALPGSTGVRLYLQTAEETLINNPDKVQLYYYNDQGKLVRESGNYYVVRDSLGRAYIDIKVTHNSEFVLSSEDKESLEIPSETSGGGSGYSGGSGTDTVSSPETTAGTDKETKEEKEEDKNATVTENEDGSVTTSTVVENEDGTKTTVDETEYADGSKAVTETTEKADGTEVSKTVVTDEKGKFVSETVAEESVTKKGTKVEESTTTFADGSTEYNKVRTTKSGKVEETTVKLDKNGKGTIELETTKKDGTSESAEFSVSKSGVVRVTNFETEGTKATVPETVSVDGKDIPVTIIGKNAFAGSDVEKVTIGANITTIGVGAFNDASSLKNIVFKATGVTKVYKGAFDGIAEDAVITIKAATKKEYNRLVKLIKKSGVAKSVKFKRSK